METREAVGPAENLKGDWRASASQCRDNCPITLVLPCRLSKSRHTPATLRKYPCLDVTPEPAALKKC